MEGFVSGFGNLDWARTHAPAKSTSPVVLATLNAGATCLGRTVMDEMAYRYCSKLKLAGLVPSALTSVNCINGSYRSKFSQFSP
jgi:Asp-tRNA(Asn)/Glu-tRNA(Gln) amidotransferase A subunit family amidase